MIILCGVRRYNAMGDLTLHGVSVCNDQFDEMFSCGLTCCLSSGNVGSKRGFRAERDYLCLLRAPLGKRSLRQGCFLVCLNNFLIKCVMAKVGR